MDAPHPRATGLVSDLCQDLKVRHRLLSAACRCLDDEKCYRFFDVLDRLSRLPEDMKDAFLRDFETGSSVDEEEMAALRRLVMNDGARAFKQLVDIVRDIRIQQEIDQMVAGAAA
jgi:hypothetical protein